LLGHQPGKNNITPESGINVQDGLAVAGDI